jgi:hypothetical protein
MTTIEIGLTVAVVVVGLLATAALFYSASNRRLMIEMASLGTELAEHVDALEKRKPKAVSPLDPQILELSDCVMDHKRHIDRLTGQMGGHKAELAQFIKLANGSEQKRDARLAALESQVAGMLVNREVLTPSRIALGSRATGSVSGGSRYGFLPEPSFTPESAAHASTDFDPETAEAQPQPNDDEATETDIKFTPAVCRAGFVPDDEKAGFEAEDLGIEEKAVVDWADAKRGEVA